MVPIMALQDVRCQQVNYHPLVLLSHEIYGTVIDHFCFTMYETSLIWGVQI